MRGLSRPKDGVASLAYDPRIHTVARHASTDGRLPPLRRFMDGRVKPGHDVDGVAQTNWKAL